VLCGAYGARCWSAARLGAAAVMAGIDPAIHAAPPQMSPGSATNGARASGTKRFDLTASLRSFSAPKHVDGRDEPGHDASGPFRAAPVFGIPWLPTTSALRIVLSLAQKQKMCYAFLFARLTRTARGRPDRRWRKEDARPDPWPAPKTGRNFLVTPNPLVAEAPRSGLEGRSRAH